MTKGWLRIALSVFACCADAHAAAPATGDLRDVELSRLSTLATADEYARRAFTPVAAAAYAVARRERRVTIRQHTIDLSRERYDLYVPPNPPAAGYGVLVFVSPMPAFPVPKDWIPELRRRGIVMVAARRSGNQHNALERRIPLALHGLASVQARYPVDSRRIYVTGFSGGSRVAMRIAFAYPDVFSGVMLIGGSDVPGGEVGAPLPPLDLMQRVQRELRIVFATGGEDLPNRGKDERTREGLAPLCIAGVRVTWQPRIGHWVPARRGFAQALDALERPVVPPAQQHDCEQALLQRVAHELDAAETALEAGDANTAAARLNEVDSLYGGLAGARVVELARRAGEGGS